MRLYLAGPVTGESWKNATSWREYVADTLQEFGIQCLSPLRGKEYLKGERRIAQAYDAPMSTPNAIVAHSRFDVASCDAVLVNLLGARSISVGTVIEIAWADALRKPLILVMEEGGVHDHVMIRELAGFTVGDLEDGIDVALTLLGL